MPKFSEERCYLTESDLVGNMKNIFGYEAPYFGKLLYLMLSGGLDKSKVPFSKFIKAFMPLKKEDAPAGFN